MTKIFSDWQKSPTAHPFKCSRFCSSLILHLHIIFRKKNYTHFESFWTHRFFLFFFMSSLVSLQEGFWQKDGSFGHGRPLISAVFRFLLEAAKAPSSTAALCDKIAPIPREAACHLGWEKRRSDGTFETVFFIGWRHMRYGPANMASLVFVHLKLGYVVFFVVKSVYRTIWICSSVCQVFE